MKYQNGHLLHSESHIFNRVSGVGNIPVVYNEYKLTFLRHSIEPSQTFHCDYHRLVIITQ